MKLSIIAFTKNGYDLALKVWEASTRCDLFSRSEITVMGSGMTDFPEYSNLTVSEWCKIRFEEKSAILFISATGIAVRACAPFVQNKLTDSPLLSMDETGKFIIPLLSGHVGGANQIALELSKQIGATPVITTATDLQGCFAVDVFAVNNHLQIVNKEGIAQVSAKALRGETITVGVDKDRMEGILPNEMIEIIPPDSDYADVLIGSREQGKHLLYLRPREYVIGLGCKKNKDADELEAFVLNQLEKCGLTTDAVASISSIDLKKDEPAIQKICSKFRLDLLTFSEEELMKLDGDFSKSDFVKNVTGVDCVCERAAVAGAGCGHNSGELIVKKVSENGMTFALAKREWRICFE